jgi:hypothetical protein
VSYRCDFCGAAVPPGTRLKLVTVDTRSRQYEPRLGANVFKKFQGHDQKGVRTVKDDPGGRGWEIVSTRAGCGACLPKQTER